MSSNVSSVPTCADASSRNVRRDGSSELFRRRVTKYSGRRNPEQAERQTASTRRRCARICRVTSWAPRLRMLTRRRARPPRPPTRRRRLAARSGGTSSSSGCRRIPSAPAHDGRRRGDRPKEKALISRAFLNSGGGIRTRDLRVMSPTTTVSKAQFRDLSGSRNRHSHRHPGVFATQFATAPAVATAGCIGCYCGR